MKNLLYLCSLILAICFFSCQKTANSIVAEINNDSISPVDSLSLYLQRIDSSGKENIFKFKKIKIQNITENFIRLWWRVLL